MDSALQYSFYFFIACSFMFGSCNGNGSASDLQKADTTKSNAVTYEPEPVESQRIDLPKGSRFTHENKFVAGSYTIVVTTYYINDTLSDYYAWEAVNWPIVEKQTITFKFNDSIRSLFNFPAKKIARKTKEGKTIKSAEMIMWDVGFVNGDRDDFFGVYEATGLCIGSYCPVYHGLFKLTGEPVYQLFTENKEQFLLTGNNKDRIKSGWHSKYDSIIASNGISVNIMHKAWENKKRIGIR